MILRLSEATCIVASAIARAEALCIHVSVAVCGLDGRLVAFSKMDGAGCMTARHAIGKAVASSISGRNSEIMPEPGDTLEYATVEAEGMAAFHEPGGLALRRDGAVIGAVGVYGGAEREQDLACATAGVAALHPTPARPPA